MKLILALLLAITGFVSAGCSVTHTVAFEDLHYPVQAIQRPGPVKVWIDRPTLAQVVPIRSGMTNFAHEWNAEPGEMLRQVVEFEFPHMFEEWELVNDDVGQPTDGMTLELYGLDYTFADFRATVHVHAVARTAGQAEPLIDQTYSGEGTSQGKKMFWEGALGMKSAMRQSSLVAFRQVFAELRRDLDRKLSGAP